jgi:hypothetical protein
MTRNRIGLLVALVTVTVTNASLFFRRWKENSLSEIPQIIKLPDATSILSGIILGLFLKTLFFQVKGKHWGSALSLIAGAIVVALAIHSIPVLSGLGTPTTLLLGLGFAFSLVAYSFKESDTPETSKNLPFSFLLFFAASLNFYLLVGPYSTHLPSFIQSNPEEFGINLQRFYYTSTNPEMAPVLVLMRAIINGLLPAPTINAMALCSMLIVCFGLGLTATVARMVCGPVWGWAFLALAWSDQWISALALNSGTIAMPIVTTTTMLLVITWATLRPATPLSRREALTLGITLMGLTIFSLYSYSAARFAWSAGSGLLGLILIARRVLRPNTQSLRALSYMALPSIFVIFSIWLIIFGANTTNFKSQLFIGPLPSAFIKDRATDPRKYISVHDNDVPIWWGTGRVINDNVSVYYQRTPSEIVAKALELLTKLAGGPPTRPEVPLLALIGIILGITSSHGSRRRVTAVIGTYALISVAPYIIGQDLSAYRRACGSNMVVSLLAVMAFSFHGRSGALKALSIAPVLFLAFAKAPVELTPLLNYSFFDPACISCQGGGNVIVKPLFNNPTYQSVRQRPIHFAIPLGRASKAFRLCMKDAIRSWEVLSESPNAKVLEVPADKFMDAIAQLPRGDIIVTLCGNPSSPTYELHTICVGTSEMAKTLAEIPQGGVEKNALWVISERK